jgi:hypothetical protein
MKKFISTSLLLGLASISPAYAYNDFINGGFEDGSFTGWTSGGGFYNGDGSTLTPSNYLPNGPLYGSNQASVNGSGPLAPDPFLPYDLGATFGLPFPYFETYAVKSIVSGGVDPNLGSTASSLVFDGAHSAKINNENVGGGVTVISQTVNNYGGTSINFAWLAALEISDHTALQTPNFIIQVTNNTRGVVLGTIAYNETSALAGNIFTNTSGWLSSGWQATSIKVSKGDSYTITLLASDCSQTGHAGYVYFDSFGSTIITEDEGGNPITPTVIYLGPTQADTNASLQNAAYQLRSAYNSQVASSNLSLTHDCNLFDVKGLCISAGGRYTAIDNPTTNASAAVVTLGYKVNQNIRIGGFLDQNINIHTPGSINVANKNPLMGLYAVWNKEASGLGYQVRLANTYQDKDVTTTRIAYGATGEAGSGTAKLNSQSYLAELSYAFQYQDKTLVRPYFGLRHTRLKRDGYSETSDTISEPLNFASLSDRSTSALIGARVNYQATPKTTFTANLGIEQDLHHKVDSLTATNTDIGELNAVAFNSNIKRTRPVASAGAYYDVTKAQRLSGTVTYQQLPFQSTGATSLYVNYMIGF